MGWEIVNVRVTQGRRDLVGPLRVEIRREARPAVAAVRAAWMSIDVQSSRGGTARPQRSTHLRARVAAATTSDATPTGVRISVRPSEVDPRYGGSLPLYLNATSAWPWRHPVFGGRARWQVQSGRPVFFGTISAREPRFRAGAERGMEQVAREF